MIQAIIFDCFGVLATDGLLPFRDKYFGNNPATMTEARDMGRQVDAGLADYNDFIRHLAHMAGISEEGARNQIENNIPDKRLFHFIESALKPSYKIGLLSNAGDNWLDVIFTPEQVALFDAVALSYEMGHTKPQREAYDVIARRLDVEPEACIFVDDQERYCIGAQDAGMQTIHYKNFDQFHAELQVLLTTPT